MRLPNLHTTPIRLFIKIRMFLKKADFSEIWSRYTTQDTFSDH